MSFFDYILGHRKSNKTASIARERLQIILAHERQGLSHNRPDYLPQLQQEIIQVISKYVAIDPNDIVMQLDKKGKLEVLEVNIILPEPERIETNA